MSVTGRRSKSDSSITFGDLWSNLKKFFKGAKKKIEESAKHPGSGLGSRTGVSDKGKIKVTPGQAKLFIKSDTKKKIVESQKEDKRPASEQPGELYFDGAITDLPTEILSNIFENDAFRKDFRSKVNMATYDTLMTQYYAIRDEPGRVSKIREEMREYNDYYDKQGNEAVFSYLRNLNYGLNESAAVYSLGQSLRTVTNERIRQQKNLTYKLDEYTKRIDRKQEALFQTFRSGKDITFDKSKEMFSSSYNIKRLEKKYNDGLNVSLKDRKLLEATGMFTKDELEKLKG